MTAPQTMWVIAGVSSVALHALVGMALYAMPMPDIAKPTHTEINIATIGAGAATRLAPAEKAMAVEGSQPAAIVQPLVPSATTEAATEAPASVLKPAALTPTTPQAAPAAATRPSLPAANAARETVAATAAREAAQSVRDEALPAVTGSEAAAPAQADPAIEARSGEAAIKPAGSTAAGPVKESLAASPTAPASTEPKQITKPAAAADAATVASINAATPEIAVAGEGIVARPTAGNVAQIRDPAAAVAGPLAPTAAPGTATVASIDAATPETAMPGEGIIARPTPANVAQTRDASAATASPLAPTAAPGTAARVGTQVAPSVTATPPAVVTAMVQRPSLTPTESDAPRRERVGIADFLATQEEGDCLLALPTSMGSTQASIEAFAAAPDAVDRLGAAYERLSGIVLKASTRPVSQDQCAALAFARSLAQYPNFPLRVTLTESAIDSGRTLSGVISGLRKDTLYLMIVDDEGKAELVEAYLEQRASLMTFRAPMTLTSGPVSSVQLLVAIASDGPLNTVPKSPGMPAEEYFSRLATEIITGNRSIAYGITSFIVR